MKTDYEELSLALLTTPTIAAAAKHCGLSEGHIHRLKRDEEFRKVLQQKRSDIFSLVNDRAIAYRERAFSILCEIAENGAEAASNRISALKQIFSIGDSARQEELEERLQKLEGNESAKYV
ncbi:MAG: hypothetical protein LBI81_03365 [Puniceicoccales bacterium]|nr:hypothetical protein [Puniceicoccales bacterium]